MKYKVSTLLLFMIIMVNFCMYENTSAQSFGKNKVQYKNFEWYYLQSEHFDVHFYKGGEEIAEFVAETAETSLILIQNSWSYRLKKRVPIILYKSHNDFQQTNVIQEYLGEGIGGVTELFKNRITIPYEGSYGQFRHVIHHELVHAVMFDMYYGGMFPGSIYSSAAFQVPLWVAEGIAEYESTGWNTETDMYNRDASINGYLEYSGQIYNPYWGGNLMFHFIAKKFGKEKIGELIRKLKQTSSLDRGLKAALGMDYEELIKQFSLYSRRRYWPDIADRKTPEEFSKRLTDHKKMKNFYNMSPALSPDGNKIAFMSDKSGKFDIYIMSAIDGKILSKVIKGEKSADFEEMHILAPGISWSPDGKYITLAAKSGKEDALYIVNAKNKSSKQFKFGLDGIFESAWSPTDDEIAFIGTQNGHSNIYAYNINTKNLRKITDDVFTEKHIIWSSDGEKIAFISDRRDYTKPEMISDEFEMYNFDYSQFDVYTVNKDGSDMQRITFTEYDEFSPAWSSDGKTIAHVAEANGIGNIFLTNIETKKSRPITNLLSGCQQLNWSRDGSKLAYVSFSDMGYDIYMIKNPLDIDSDEIELKNTVYFDELEKEKKKDDTEETVAISDESGEDLAPNMSKFIFDRSLSDNNISLLPKSEFEEKKPESKESGGKGKEYKIKKYKLKFSPDVIMGNAGYDTYFGVQGTSIVQITDILGNHQIQIGTDLYFDLRNSNYYIFYGYLSRRTDYMVGIYQDARYFTGYYNLLGMPVGSYPFRLRNFGFQAFASRPFSRFSRADFGVNYSSADQTYFTDYETLPTKKITNVQLSLSLTKDTSLWGPNFFPISPLDGARYNLTVYTSPALSNDSYNPSNPRQYVGGTYTAADNKGSLSFTTVNVDLRKYLRIGNQYGFAFRASGGASFGRDPENFYLGGMDNWLNRKFYGDIRDGLKDIFYSKFITPLRGAYYYQLVGSKYFLFNTEFRFPLIQYLLLGWPLPIGFQHIRGSLFCDVGGAWDPYEMYDASSGKWVIGDPFRSDYDQHEGFRAKKPGTNLFEDMSVSMGLGARGVFLFLLARFDVAWLHNGEKFSSPHYIFSVGFDF